MSSEQAKGRIVDKRTDIFAFGCVLYEMLTGRRAFDGEDVTEILGAVVRMEPDWSRLPVGLPPRVPELLELCLRKDAKQRRRDAGDLILDIEHATESPGVKPATTKSSRLGWIAATGALAMAASIAVVHFTERPLSPPDEMRVDIITPSAGAPLQF